MNARRKVLRRAPQLVRLEDKITPASVENVLVNDANVNSTKGTQNETSTVVFGNTIVSAFNDSRTGDERIAYARSDNGGASFTDLGILANSGDDPSIARDNGFIAPNKTAPRIYLSVRGPVPGPFAGRPLVYHSDDNGVTFESPVEAFKGVQGSLDKDWITVDNFPGDHVSGNGNVYAISFELSAGIRISTSKVHGDSDFAVSGTIIGSALAQWGFVTVGPDHSVYVFYYEDPGFIRMRRSTDQGSTFGPPVDVADLAGIDYPADLGFEFKTFTQPQAVVNPTNENQIFMTFHKRVLSAGDRSNVYLYVSNDKGATWQPWNTPGDGRVNDDTTTNDQFNPSIAITPDATKLVVSFYDRRVDPANRLIDYFASTFDINGGSVVARPNQRITNRSFPAVINMDPARTPRYMGEYDVVNADNNTFYFVWGDNRDAELGDGQVSNVRFAKTTASATGPQVLRYTPFGGQLYSLGQAALVNQVNLYFNQGMDTTSFNVSDDVIAFTGPEGDLTPSISGFNWVGNQQLQISFASQTKLGAYSMVIGPNVVSAKGVAMDDNLDGVASGISATFTLVNPVVDEIVDKVDGKYDTGQRSLRELIGLANSTPGTPTIAFDPGVFSAPTALKLALRDIVITNSMKIVGPAQELVIDAQNLSRIFNIDVPNSSPQSFAISIEGMTLVNGFANIGASEQAAGLGGGAMLVNDGAVTLTSATLLNNKTDQNGGGAIMVTSPTSLLAISMTAFINNLAQSGGPADATRLGGAIFTMGSLLVSDSTFSNNSAAANGGAIYGSGSSLVMMTRVSVTNSSAQNGAGVFLRSFGTVNIAESTISQNFASVSGGGLFLFDGDSKAKVRITASTIDNNTEAKNSSAGAGGGIAVEKFAGALSIQNCTVSTTLSTFGNGGGIAIGKDKSAPTTGTIKIFNSTIAFNSATGSGATGGGIYHGPGFVSPASDTLSGSLVANNSAATGPDISGTITASFNYLRNINGIVFSTDLFNDKSGDDPLLTSLDFHGGPTKTHALAIGSKAIDNQTSGQMHPKGWIIDVDDPATDPALATMFVRRDQRGEGRLRIWEANVAIDKRHADNGAFEYQPPLGVESFASDGTNSTSSHSRVNHIIVTFDQAVNFPNGVGAAFELTRDGPGGPTGLVTISPVVIDSQRVKLTFSGSFTESADTSVNKSLIDGRYTLKVLSANAFFGSSQIDGDAMGGPGGDFVSLEKSVYRLFGDGDDNLTVNTMDYNAFASAFGVSSLIFDFNGDGSIDMNDFKAFQARFGSSL